METKALDTVFETKQMNETEIATKNFRDKKDLFEQNTGEFRNFVGGSGVFNTKIFRHMFTNEEWNELSEFAAKIVIPKFKQMEEELNSYKLTKDN